MEAQQDIIGSIKIVGKGVAKIYGRSGSYTYSTDTELEERLLRAVKENEICKFGVTSGGQIKSIVLI